MKTHPILLIWLALSLTFAQSPTSRWLSLQGTLQQSGGERMPNGRHEICQRLFDHSSQGKLLLEECDSVMVRDGYYQSRMGDQKSLPALHGEELWLEVQVNGTLLEGRIPLTAAPFAWTAQSVSDSILPGTGMGPGIAVRSLNGLKDHVFLTTAGSISLSRKGDTLRLSGTDNDSFTASERAKLEFAYSHAQNPSPPASSPPDTLDRLHLRPQNSIPACQAETEGTLFYRKQASQQSAALMLCHFDGSAYFWNRLHLELPSP